MSTNSGNTPKNNIEPDYSKPPGPDVITLFNRKDDNTVSRKSSQHPRTGDSPPKSQGYNFNNNKKNTGGKKRKTAKQHKRRKGRKQSKARK